MFTLEKIKKGTRLLGKGPPRDFFSWSGICWEAAWLDNDLLRWACMCVFGGRGAGGRWRAKGLEVLVRGRQAKSSFPQSPILTALPVLFPLGVIPCCAPHLVSGVR